MAVTIQRLSHSHRCARKRSVILSLPVFLDLSRKVTSDNLGGDDQLGGEATSQPRL
jgi:hypothetical protein